MYEGFRSNFAVDSNDVSVDTVHSFSEFHETHLNELFRLFGGQSFNGGLYRIFAMSDVARWGVTVGRAFPEFSGNVTCFGFDWLGRIFALDSRRLEGGLPGVVMFEPGTGAALDIPCNISSFHDAELSDYQEEALAASFYAKWVLNGGGLPNTSQCIGYKKPLFLGGDDTIDNLEISNMDVYWSIAEQVIAKTRGLSMGTRVGSARID